MQEKKELVLKNTEQFVFEILEKEPSGHDWWHIYRVRKMAKKIAVQEKADVFICEMAALLHDIADEKLNASETIGLQKVTQWLNKNHLAEKEQQHILAIITSISYKGGNQKNPLNSLEAKIVQDADRLDAIGAIGIARVMSYSGHTGRIIHDPTITPRETMSLEEYRTGTSTAIMHFYEKLLKLKDQMNTTYGKKIAKKRHTFLQTYLDEFYAEWDAEK